MEHKPTKRDIERSEKNLAETMNTHRLNSPTDEIARKAYIRIGTNHLAASETSLRIKERFDLPPKA